MAATIQPLAVAAQRAGLTQALDHMIKFLAVALLITSSNLAFARDRHIISCERAELLSEMQKNLPDHVLGTTADVKPKLLTKMTRTSIPAVSIINRAHNRSLICIVLAIDTAGKVQDAAISYPNISLTKAERDQLLKLEYSPAQHGGHAVPSLVNIDITLK